MYIYICILLLFIIIDIIIIYFNVAYELISRKPPIGDGLYMKTLPPSGIAGVPPPSRSSVWNFQPWKWEQLWQLGGLRRMRPVAVMGSTLGILSP